MQTFVRVTVNIRTNRKSDTCAINECKPVADDINLIHCFVIQKSSDFCGLPSSQCMRFDVLVVFLSSLPHTNTCTLVSMVNSGTPLGFTFEPAATFQSTNHIHSTYSTTRLERFLKAKSGMWVMRFRARVMACRDERSLSALTGISVRALSSSHRCRKDRMPEKVLAGTSMIRLASRRLLESRGTEASAYVYCCKHIYYSRVC